MIKTCTILCASTLAVASPLFAMTPAEVGKRHGYSDAEIQSIRKGELIGKPLKEKSPRELAGVVAVWFPKSVKDLAVALLAGKMQTMDKTTKDFHAWKVDQSADEIFGKMKVTDDEGKEMEALRRHCEAYSKDGIKGIENLGGSDKRAKSVAEDLEVAIKESEFDNAVKGYEKALLAFPKGSLRDMEHRLYAYKQEVDKKPAFILSHRAGVVGKDSALITEQRYYVSHGYNCRLVAVDAVAMDDGTLAFFVNRTFTDQVAGFGSGMKHNMGRKRMLASVTESLKEFRDKLK